AAACRAPDVSRAGGSVARHRAPRATKDQRWALFSRWPTGEDYSPAGHTVRRAMPIGHAAGIVVGNDVRSGDGRTPPNRPAALRDPPETAACLLPGAAYLSLKPEIRSPQGSDPD